MLKNRRDFIKTSSAAAVGTSTLGLFPKSDPCGVKSKLSLTNMVGPKEGYSSHIGALVSMMNWMRDTVLSSVRNMNTSDLDYLHDENSNSIGAMLWHLAATERFYQLNTFEDREWGDWPSKDREEFQTAMSLGDNGREIIKGNSLDFYLEKLERVREYSLKELKNRDDEWLLKGDHSWGWSGGVTNNYCKWFHVVEHESNHNGQIKYLRSRIS